MNDTGKEWETVPAGDEAAANNNVEDANEGEAEKPRAEARVAAIEQAERLLPAGSALREQIVRAARALGAPTVGVLSAAEPNKLVAARMGPPAVIGIGAAPRSARLACTFASARPVPIAPFNVATMSAGVFVGAPTPAQPLDS